MDHADHKHYLIMTFLQLDNPDEQAAQVRRELASRQHQLDSQAYKKVCIASFQFHFPFTCV